MNSPFTDALIAGVPLIAVVIGLVEYAKRLGVHDKPLLGVSMGIGLLLGAGYMVAVHGAPVDFAGWFSVAVYGLGLGLVASGIYDAAVGNNRREVEFEPPQ